MQIQEKKLLQKPRTILCLLYIFIGMLSCNLSYAALEEGKQLLSAEAFVLQVNLDKNKNLEFYWQIAPGYYLYQDQLSILNEDNQPIITAKKLPLGIKIHDKAIGEYTVYANSLVVRIPWSNNFRDHNFIVSYQGCAKNGFCYQPINKQLYISPESTIQLKNTTQSTFNKTNNEAETDRLAATIKNRFLPVTLGMFFILGIMLAFSPCVLPMIPLIVNLIVGPKHISSHKAFVLASCYVLGMAGSYAIAGMFVGILGSTLQAWLQQPLILMLLSSVLIVLALVQFEIINISLPHFNKKLHHWGRQQLQGSLLGAFILGAIASLIISPCITPPLIGSLTYIWQDGNPIVGALTLLSLGFGMGVPLIIVALLSSVILPTAGPWMNLIKSITGIALLGLAIWLLERFIPGDLSLILWGALCIVTAVFFKAFQHIKHTGIATKILKGFGLLLAIFGSLLIVNSLRNEYRPMVMHQWHNINQPSELDAYLSQAKHNQQFTILEFYADWCTSCKKIEAEVLANSEVRKNLKSFMLLRIDITNLEAQQHELMNRFQVYGPPAILFFNKNSEEIRSKRAVGEVTVGEMLKLIKN